MEIVLKFVRSEIHSLKGIKNFSDGCTSQFKNRFILTNLPKLESLYNLKISWSFLATSNGKGAVDSIGAIVKRCVWNGIVSAEDFFFSYATVNLKGIKTFYVNQNLIEENRVHLSDEWNMTPKIRNLQNQHFFHVKEESIMSLKDRVIRKKLI